MKVAFCTHVSDDWFVPCGGAKLVASARYFHPEVPFYVFDSKAIEDVKAKHNVGWDTLIAPICQQLAHKFDLVVHFDADSCIVGKLDEILAGDYDVAGVRNNNDRDCAGAFGSGYSMPNVPADKYLNAGLVAATVSGFWWDWATSNNCIAHEHYFAEQDVYNKLIYTPGLYKFKLLDPKQKPVYYGIASHDGPGSHYASWSRAELIDGKLMLNAKQLKVLHQAGGHRLPKMVFEDWFKGKELEFLNEVTRYTGHTNPPFPEPL